MSLTPIPARTGLSRRSLGRRLLHFGAVAGPGLIVMVADNDAGAISTYTQAGAEYGTSLMWVLLALLPVTYFVQEMVVRLGIATGQGLTALISRYFGRPFGRFTLFALLTVNFLTLITEFAAVALAADALGIPPLQLEALAVVGVLLLVSLGSYQRWERLTLVLCGLNLAWFGLAFRVQPDWAGAARDTVLPHLPVVGPGGGLMVMIIAVVGTTLSPWQLFFQQACVADKGLRGPDLTIARIDTALGAVAVIVFAGCMLLIGDALFRAGLPYVDPARMAGALVPRIGPSGRTGLLLLMINAALLGATTISLSSAWAWSEVMGGRNGFASRPHEAPAFYAVYGTSSIAAACVSLLPGAPLQAIILAVQVLAGIMLPPTIVLLQRMLSDRGFLPDQFTNRQWNTWLNWAIVALLFTPALVLGVRLVLPNLWADVL